MIEYDVRAGQPVIYMITAEESRAELELAKVAKSLKRDLWTWSHTEGFFCPSSKEQDQQEDPIEALQQAKTMPSGRMIVFRDLHLFFKGGGAQKILRLIRDIARDFKQSKKTLILLSPVMEIPPELERDVMVVDFDLPTEQDLATIFDGIYEGAKKEIGGIDPDEREKIIQGAAGLTTIEAETAFSKAIVVQVRSKKENKQTKAISSLVLAEKAAAVKKGGILEYFEAKETADSIGGLGALKKWLDIRSRVFSKKAKEFGLPKPRGIILAGLPGCGKSLSCKAASNIIKVPLIRFDVSRVFGGLVGQSEANTRNALKTIDALGASITWIDELEKAFAGMGGEGSNDSGVSKRVFGQIITWMQEKKGNSFMMATVNDISTLPSELLRKGRWDEIFFVGLPTKKERKEIFNIAIKKYGRDPMKMDQKVLEQCAEESVEFSGAEIEEAVVSGLYYAFYKGKELNADYIWGAIKGTTPLAKSRKEQLDFMRKWAEKNALNASDEVVSEGEKFTRVMELA